MKEFYVAPEVELLCLAPEEQLALLPQDFDDYLGGSGENTVSGVVIDPDADLDYIFP